MKSFTLPVIAVLGLCLLCGFAALGSFSSAARARARLSAVEELSAAQQRQLVRLQQGLDAMAMVNGSVSRFLTDWCGDFGCGEEMVPTFNEFNTIATSHQVSQGPRNQDNAASYTFKGKSFKVKRYLYSVSGDFALLMGWLRDAEARFPLARFEAVTINNTGQSLEMQTAVVFPREFKIPQGQSSNCEAMSFASRIEDRP